jgi:cytochrome c oxidase subunit 4
MAREKVHKELSYRFLLMVLAALFALTALTVGASTINLGALNVWIALLIATAKASLVLLFFMHLKYENMVLKLSFLATFGFLAIIIGFIFLDIAFR